MISYNPRKSIFAIRGNHVHTTKPERSGSIMTHFLKPLNILLVFAPVALVLELVHGAPLLIFITSALAVVPLSGILGDASRADWTNGN